MVWFEVLDLLAETWIGWSVTPGSKAWMSGNVRAWNAASGTRDCMLENKTFRLSCDILCHIARMSCCRSLLLVRRHTTCNIYYRTRRACLRVALCRCQGNYCAGAARRGAPRPRTAVVVGRALVLMPHQMKPWKPLGSWIGLNTPGYL